MQSQRCNTCNFWDTNLATGVVPATEKLGHCRRYPPRVHFIEMIVQNAPSLIKGKGVDVSASKQIQMQPYNPVTTENQFCGEHSELKEKLEYDPDKHLVNAGMNRAPTLAEALELAKKSAMAQIETMQKRYDELNNKVSDLAPDELEELNTLANSLRLMKPPFTT